MRVIRWHRVFKEEVISNYFLGTNYTVILEIMRKMKSLRVRDVLWHADFHRIVARLFPLRWKQHNFRELKKNNWKIQGKAANFPNCISL